MSGGKGGKKLSVKQAPPDSMVKPKEPLLVTIVACTT